MGTRLITGIFAVFLIQISLFAKGGPCYQVTTGSEFSVDAKDVGLTEFRGKPKLMIYQGRKVVTVNTKVSSDRSKLDATWTKPLPAGCYQLVIETEDENGDKFHTDLTDFFTIQSPRIHQVSPVDAKEGEALTINGEFFSTKCKIYIGDYPDNMQPCKITTSNKEIMDPTTGASMAEVIVPKKITSVNDLTIMVESAIGTDMESIDENLANTTSQTFVVSVSDMHETSKYVAAFTDFIKTFKETHKDLTIAVSAGDILSAYTRKSYDPEWARDLYTEDPATHGVEMFKLLADVAFDAITLGNHDPCLGMNRILSLFSSYPHPMGAANLYLYKNSEYIPWIETTSDSFLVDTVNVKLKGLDVGIVLSGSTLENEWEYDDLDNYKVCNAVNERVADKLKKSSLLNDIVILVTHENDLSAIKPVYGGNPPGIYLANSDIYNLKDLDNIALIVGGHEHKNIFRRASYSGDNDTYNLYIDKVYNPDSKLALVKSSKFFGEYVGVVRIDWNKDTRTLENVKLIEGKKGDDGKYLGCETENLVEVDDGGMLQELDDSPWNPTVPTNWWRMDDWPME